ncbi:hypothetical protein PAXRUDRAFT_30764 [Paxillus rubicundulus Ve08.2h10]|uniref:Zn(2)-C6 fungal-type domain-containing protein n=1 Tax=Paxillus rubicundulus Ve08.2h10 TaxID=930991 RepID=A0A0D0E918_9AGAM|nr:hypothetical protein PAXRUDRAFT_30764 [Paxillus rubicundulus Ve08.2h10]
MSIEAGIHLSTTKLQACHQCRRRKMRCDAKRPCSTCVRSHSHATVHAQPGIQLAPFPECTYDEVARAKSSGPTTENRCEHLESRIMELETLLKQKQEAIVSLAQPSANPASSSAAGSLHAVQGASSTANSSSAQTSQNPDNLHVTRPHRSIVGDSPAMFGILSGDLVGQELGVLWQHWPHHLPRPDLLRHIVEVFFAFHPHATRLFNMSNFMISLSLRPDHPDFPSPSVLHAICAVGSMYTIPRQESGSSDASFAEQQAMYAKDQLGKDIMSGRKLVQYLQDSKLFVSTGQSLRVAVPLGLNLCPPFHALNATVQSMSIIPSPLTIVEDEMRRNVFWLAYAIDRQHGAGNGWALSLDDTDIAQLLPLPRATLDAGIPVSAENRQWSHFRETFLVHPPGITDSFTLYIKTMMIISRIKSFNHRFRVMENIGDLGSTVTRMNRWNEPDVRSAPTFSQLEELLTSFRCSLPHEFKDPFLDGHVDTYLYTTHLALHASIILLHEPHSNFKTSICTSAMKILHAARGILDLLYAVWSTNYDLGLLDLFCPFCWYLAGRVFGRFLKAAQDVDSAQQIETIQVELEFIRISLGKMGERVPLATRYQKMLDASILEICGALVTITVPVNGVPVRTVADDSLLRHVAQTSTPAYDLATFMKLYNGFLEDV